MSGADLRAIGSRVAGAGIWMSLAWAAVLGVAPAPALGVAADAAACLRSPKSTAPQGERWYYRVERGTKRHCWYTRTEVPRKSTAQIPHPPERVERPAEPAPLQSSVANARAEADLSALPRTVVETAPSDERSVNTPLDAPGPTWTLADRWSNRVDADPVVRTPPMRLTPPTPTPTEPSDADEEAPDDGLRAVAAGTVALLGLSMVLIAMLMRQRKRDRPDRGWHFAQRCADAAGPRPHLTDLNDEPLMTWRKRAKDELREVRLMNKQRDATIRRGQRLT